MIGRREEEENCLQKIKGKTVRVHALFWEGLVLKVREQLSRFSDLEQHQDQASLNFFVFKRFLFSIIGHPTHAGEKPRERGLKSEA